MEVAVTQITSVEADADPGRRERKKQRTRDALFEAAMELFAKNFAVVAIPGIAKPLDFIPADYEKRLVKNDFAWEAKNRDKILAEWLKRYDGKSEPKS